ncbi:peptidase S8/S53 domain-containing protein [Gongronella butleri]|nr:peptidase S8/S53 domain-containing protein [Gongronella butleri]
MIFKRLFTLLFCVVALANATSIGKSDSQQYIMLIDPATDLLDFIPNLIKGVFGLIGDLFDDIGDAIDDLTHLEKRTKEHGFEVLETFNLDNTFKAVSTKVAKDDILTKILKHFDEITNIVPDDEINFHLPKPQKSLQERYYMRNDGPHQRNGVATKSNSTSSNTTTAVLQQKNAEWHLSRISQRKINYKQPYAYPASSGSGVHVYVIDDGINKDHEDFGGRAEWGFSMIKDGDDNGGGHGTHVAGIIGGKTYGVAKNVSLISVRVLKKNGDGAVSNVLSGLQWAVKDAKKHKNKALINLSLGINNIAPQADVLNKAVTAAVKAGIPVIAAAGNMASDACEIVPAGNPLVYTVAASDKTDSLDKLSCYGKCVSIAAPGVDVLSDYIGSPNATETMSGTSMAAPHVTGVAALLLPTLKNPSPKVLYDALTKLATPKMLQNLPDKKTPNLIIFNNATISNTTPSSNSTQTTHKTKKPSKPKKHSKSKKHTKPKKHSKDKKKHSN